MSTFEGAIETVLKHEGGYVSDPDDPGGETNFGISKRTYPDIDIPNLTRGGAAEIYRRDWWDSNTLDKINSQPVATKLFDLMVNMGTHQAVKIFQRAVCDCGLLITVDGVLGKQTIESANAMSSDELLTAIRSRAGEFYRSLVTQKPSNIKFLDGWLKRAYS